jgi:hypothetical protein
MVPQTHFPLLDDILGEWRPLIGPDYAGYRNHVCRMLNFCLALHDCGPEETEKLTIAGAFHDIGLWTAKTLDYLPPSLPPARDYLAQRGLQAWITEIELMITEHHKLRRYTNPAYPLVEVFRKGDLVDFSLGAVRFGLPSDFIREVKAAFPNKGFHANLARLGAKWFVKHPLNPAPMMKW